MNPLWPDREQVEMDCMEMGSEGYHGKADRMMRLMEQRDAARECLRDVLDRFSPHVSGSAWIDRPDANGVWWLYRQQCRGLFYGDDQVRLVFIDGPRMSFDRRTWYTTERYLTKQPEARWMRIVKPSPPNVDLTGSLKPGKGRE